jgi:hypothetical protein
VANDEEQALSRVFQTAVQLIKYNPELTPSATVQTTQIKFTNGSVIRAVSSDYKPSPQATTLTRRARRRA